MSKKKLTYPRLRCGARVSKGSSQLCRRRSQKLWKPCLDKAGVCFVTRCGSRLEEYVKIEMCGELNNVEVEVSYA
jgi:hypothetical protein